VNTALRNDGGGTEIPHYVCNDAALYECRRNFMIQQEQGMTPSPVFLRERKRPKELLLSVMQKRRFLANARKDKKGKGASSQRRRVSVYKQRIVKTDFKLKNTSKLLYYILYIHKINCIIYTQKGGKQDEKVKYNSS
jgi:hypothetical protein